MGYSPSPSAVFFHELARQLSAENRELVHVEKQTPKECSKTILIADDDGAILKFVSLFLIRSGFHVLTAQSGEDAIKQSKEYEGAIHLLLSNIQMPEMTGIDLGTKLSMERPEIKVMLMSGFASGMLILDSGWQFLPKPFIPSQLRDLILNILAPPADEQIPDLDEHTR